MGDAQEKIRQLQQSLSNARRRGFPGFGGPGGGGSPKGIIGSVGGLLLFGGGSLFVYNALFNGKRRHGICPEEES